MIGTKIRTIREEKKIKQLDIAVRLGIEQSTYAKIENGQIKITVERLFILAKILDVPITYFFEDIGVNEKNNEAQLQEIIKLLNTQNTLFETQNDLYAKLLEYIEKREG